MDRKILDAAKDQFEKIVYRLWSIGAEKAHETYPSVSVVQFNNANALMDSKRCPDCSCGYCVNVPELAENLLDSPNELKPIADLAIEIAKKEYA